MNNLHFTKLEAIGNNFVLINGFETSELDWSLMAVMMSAHHFGVGSDGLLVLLPSDTASLRMRMFNPDGTEDACGNGLRCAAVYAHITGICRDREMTIEAMDGIHEVYIVIGDDGIPAARVNMGKPSFCLKNALVKQGSDLIDYPLEVNGDIYKVTCVVVGTPHAVIYAPLESFWDHMPDVSALIETHPAFPDKVSVTWYAPISNDEIRIRTWERAVGPTLGCGTGACSALVAANLHDQAGDYAYVTSPGGTLFIEWHNRDDIFMTGPAMIVFEGEWPLQGDEEVQVIA
ncbi:MAG: diaminopimelate epimerase [Armatimonadota bacterium]